MKTALLGVLCMSTFFDASAQNASTFTDEEFRLAMRSLVSRGNICYETSDRYGIKLMLDSLGTCLSQRSQAGKLTEMDSLEFTADWYKLSGSYHYENSYYDSKSYGKAHESYQKALEIYRGESAFDSDLRCEPMVHRELAQLYYKEKDYQKAFNHTKIAYDSFEAAANLQAIDEDDPDYLDIQTQMAICQARMGNTKESLAMMDRLIMGYPPSDMRYSEVLRKKAKILMLQEENEEKANHNEALGCYKTFFGLKKKDALAHFLGMNSMEREQYWMRIRPFVTDCYRLEETDAGLLFDVTLFAKGLLLQLDSAGGGKQNIHATWQMIQEKLKPEACAIEFIQYEKYDKQKMGALVLKKTGEPIFVKMASPDSIWNHIIADRTVADRLKRTDNNNYNAIDRVYNDTLGLRQKIWSKELLDAIGDCKIVYFAPDGYIHRIAIEYLLPSELSEKTLYRLTSTRRLLDKPNISKSSKALIIGDVDFTRTDSYPNGNNDALAYRSIGRVFFMQLKKSKEEVDSIFICRGNPTDTLLCGVKATEQEFRRLCGDYPIIHISSHGKFKANGVPFGTDMKPCLTDVSLSESIIALAGVNKALDDESFDAEHSQDGLLSAREISSLDMKDVQLAVLACCETGLGHITSDGVYGIQRGFKNAGAGAMIMTLWETDDDTTAAFILAFHKKLCDGKSIGKAFRETREEYLAIDDYNVNRPCYRDVFILIDAIE